MAGVIQKPDSISLSGNLNRFILGSGEKVSFSLEKNGSILFENRYEPGPDHIVRIDLRDVVDSALAFEMSTASNVWKQTSLSADFKAIIDGVGYSFKAVRGGVASLQDTPANWLKLHFLTWQPSVKRVTYNSPEWLTMFAVDSATVKLKAHFADETVQTIVIASVDAGYAYTMNMQYAYIAGLLTDYPTYYEVWFEIGSQKSEVQIYAYDEVKSINEQWFLFENSLGGIDTVRMSGVNKIAASHEHETALFDDLYEEYKVDTERLYNKNTGFLDEYERRWIMDFFPSKRKYIYEDFGLREIIVTGSTVSTNDGPTVPASFNFIWRRAEDTLSLNLVKNKLAIPPEITLPDLTSPNFILPPRLAEFPRVLLSEGVLLPAIDPSSNDPTVTTYGAIHQEIRRAIVNDLQDELAKIRVETGGGGSGSGSGGTFDGNIIRSTDSIEPSDSNVFSALRSTIEFVSKVKNDTVAGILTFLKGLHIGQFVTGMIGGSGAALWLDENRKSILEIDRIHAREELIVPKITFNCIDVISGDKANTFAYGTIKTVDKANFIATLDLLEDEWGTLHESDICRGVFHNIDGENDEFLMDDANGFLKYSGFTTSYFAIEKVLESKKGYMQFLYSLQPGTASHPVPGMNFFAYGNFFDKARMGITYENRYYRRVLDGVRTWTIDPNVHIMFQSGLLDGLNIGGMQMEGHGTFQKNSYLTGVQIQFTPDQIKQFAAYSVVLSCYETSVTVDEEGNIVSSTEFEANVVAGEQNVTTGLLNVVTGQSSLATHVQAYRAAEELAYKEGNVPAKDTYTLDIQPNGCTAHVSNGIVYVDGFTRYTDVSVDITVNCEGYAVIEKQFVISVKRNGQSNFTADLSNEMVGLHVDRDGAVNAGLPVTTVVHAWYGMTELPIDKFEISAPAGVTVSSNTSTGEVTVSAVTAAAAKVLEVNIRVYATFAGVQYSKLLVFTMTKLEDGDTPVVYDLLPSDTAIRMVTDKETGDRTYSVFSISCTLRRIDGLTPPENISWMPSGYAMKYSIDGGNQYAYQIGNPVYTSSALVLIRFYLYYGDTLVDKETIPIITDGMDGADGDPGDPGKDSYTYTLSPEHMSVGRTSTGSVEPSAYTVTCYKNGNSTRTKQTAKWSVYGSNNNSTWTLLQSQDTYVSSISVNLSSSYKYYRIDATPDGVISCSAFATTVLDGGKGDPGDPGPRGSMPRACGLYNSNTTYVYNADYRDIVYDSNGNVWMVASYGSSVKNSTPSSSNSNWVQGNKAIFTAIDTALIDGANIAGFSFKNNKMQGGSGTLILDGVNGSITATKGTIGGFTISNDSLSGNKMTIANSSGIRFNDSSLSVESKFGSNVISAATGATCGLYINNKYNNGNYSTNGFCVLLQVGQATGVEPKKWIECSKSGGYGCKFFLGSAYFKESNGRERLLVMVHGLATRAQVQTLDTIDSYFTGDKDVLYPVYMHPRTGYLCI